MDLITKDIMDALRRGWANTGRYEDGGGRAFPGYEENAPVVKLFTPDANATWLISEISEDGEHLFGLCDLGLGCPELGYVGLAELRALRGRLHLPVERDVSFRARASISVYAQAATEHGAIVAGLEALAAAHATLTRRAADEGRVCHARMIAAPATA